MKDGRALFVRCNFTDNTAISGGDLRVAGDKVALTRGRQEELCTLEEEKLTSRAAASRGIQPS